jgi:beta-galactosidase
MRAIVRPGPFIMAEVKNEGIPYRVYDDTPHLLPTTWDGARITTRTLDYLAPEFLDAVDGRYGQVMPLIAERLVDRGGPVIAVQLDNEIGMLSWVSNSPDLTDGVCEDVRPDRVHRGTARIRRPGRAGGAAEPDVRRRSARPGRRTRGRRPAR